MSSALTSVVEHVTREGDRWDSIAWEYYGDATAYEPIIAANPSIPISPVLPSGIKLYIPVITSEETVSTEGLPPWKT
jgi:phage tail protein X